MLMDPMGGIVMTNDGNAILREVYWQSDMLINFDILATLQMTLKFDV